MERRVFIKNAGIAGSILAVAPMSFCTAKNTNDFPMMDLHVHLTNTFTINHVLDISKRTGVKIRHCC